MTLTIDATIQAFAEKAAPRGHRRSTPPKSVARCLAMQPQYRARSSPWPCKPALRSRTTRPGTMLAERSQTAACATPSISDAYEPGSTCEVLTAAAALDAGVTSESFRTGFYCSGSVYVEGGRITLLGRAPRRRDPGPGAAELLQPRVRGTGLCALASERFYDYHGALRRRLRHGRGPPRRGRTASSSPASRGRSRGDLARIGFGQSVAVTPLQPFSPPPAPPSTAASSSSPTSCEEDPCAPDGQVIERGRAAVRRPAPSPRRPAAAMRRLLHLRRAPTAGGRKNAYGSRATASAARPAPPRCTWTACRLHRHAHRLASSASRPWRIRRLL